MQNPALLSPLNFRGQIYILTKQIISRYINNPQTENYEVELLLNYIRFYSGKCYMLSSCYSKIQEKVSDDLLAYIDSLIKNGGDLVGKGTFNDEAKDILFLSGLASLTNGGNTIFVIRDKTENLDLDGTKHKDVLMGLNKLGVNSFSCTLIDIDSIANIIRSEKEFLDHIKNQYI